MVRTINPARHSPVAIANASRNPKCCASPNSGPASIAPIGKVLVNNVVARPGSAGQQILHVS